MIDHEMDEIELGVDDIEFDMDEVDDDTLEAIAGGCHSGDMMGMGQGFDWAGYQQKMALLAQYQNVMANGTRQQQRSIIESLCGPGGPFKGLGKLMGGRLGRSRGRK